MLYVATVVGVYEWPISDRAVCMDVAFYQFSNHTSSSASGGYAMTFLIILYCTCNGLFYGDISVISLLGFCLRENILLLFIEPLVVTFMMHLNIYGESF